MFIFVLRLDYGILPPETAIGAGFLNRNQWIHSAHNRDCGGAIESRAECLCADVRSVSPSSNEQTGPRRPCEAPGLKHLE